MRALWELLWLCRVSHSRPYLRLFRKFCEGWAKFVCNVRFRNVDRDKAVALGWCPTPVCAPLQLEEGQQRDNSMTVPERSNNLIVWI